MLHVDRLPLVKCKISKALHFEEISAPLDEVLINFKKVSCLFVSFLCRKMIGSQNKEMDVHVVVSCSTDEQL